MMLCCLNQVLLAVCQEKTERKQSSNVDEIKALNLQLQGMLLMLSFIRLLHCLLPSDKDIKKGGNISIMYIELKH